VIDKFVREKSMSIGKRIKISKIANYFFAFFSGEILPPKIPPEFSGGERWRAPAENSDGISALDLFGALRRRSSISRSSWLGRFLAASGSK
jgi:hypothetical protein